MKTFNPTSKHPARALQAWQILISKAMNRQTVTYEDLSYQMFNRKAPLTDIVVGKGRGTPGTDIPLDPAKFDRERERVYTYDWYNVYPPSEEELEQAYRAHTP
jgi:hypothetical protein